jgi:hypothetical protein
VITSRCCHRKKWRPSRRIIGPTTDIRSIRRSQQISTPSSFKPTGEEIIDKILAARESRKDSARAERAGTVTGSEAFGGGHQERGRDAEIARLKLAIRRNPNDTNLAAQLAKFCLNGDD